MKPTYEEIMKQREEYNTEILFLLAKYLDKHPEIRFGQALVNLNILERDNSEYSEIPKYKDPYNDEPIVIHKRMSRYIS
jgi:hypothetical protein